MYKKVQRYEEQCELILSEVETIERENLELMSELFECNVEDLKVTRLVWGLSVNSQIQLATFDAGLRMWHHQVMR